MTKPINSFTILCLIAVNIEWVCWSMSHSHSLHHTHSYSSQVNDQRVSSQSKSNWIEQATTKKKLFPSNFVISLINLTQSVWFFNFACAHYSLSQLVVWFMMFQCLWQVDLFYYRVNFVCCFFSSSNNMRWLLLFIWTLFERLIYLCWIW
jgi:hypothetical protein